MSNDIENNNKPRIDETKWHDAKAITIKASLEQTLKVIRWNDGDLQISITEPFNERISFCANDLQDKQALKAFAIEILKQLD